jgi:thiol-disulfide isomerase/thioredoxin
MLLICCCTSAMGQQGMEFFKGSWAELIAAAQQQKKMIFVDVYTDWCGPCKHMDKFIFPLEEVGKKYNPAFINYKLDAEKGEGPRLASKFNIRAYPTFLFLNSDSSLVLKIVGEKEAAGLNRLADSALQTADKNALANMETEFKKGNRDLAFLKKYITKLTQLDVDNSAPLDAYFKAVPAEDLAKEETLVFLGNNLFGTQSSSFIYFIEHYTSLSKTAKDQLQDRLYAQIVGRSVPLAISQKRFPELKQLLSYVGRINPLTEKQNGYLDRLKLVYYDMVRDVEQVKAVGYQWIDRYKNISDDSIRSENARQYKNFITPFLNGSKDSTQYSEFKEANAVMKVVYSKNVAYGYYYPASLFAAFPDTETVALRDALQWVTRAQSLDPSVAVYKDLIAVLQRKLKITPAEK